MAARSAKNSSKSALLLSINTIYVWNTSKTFMPLSLCHSCSNIALKVNAKLSNSVNKACAWGTRAVNAADNIPWVSEAPTLVVGISISSGYGRETMSVISASACLDKGCMQFAQDVQVQSKSKLIDAGILADMTKVCSACSCLSLQFVGLSWGLTLYSFSSCIKTDRGC